MVQLPYDILPSVFTDQNSLQRHPVHLIFFPGHASGFSYGWKQVNRADRIGAHFASRHLSRPRNDQWHSRCGIIETSLSVAAIISQQFAVIGGIDDKSVFKFALCLKFIQNTPYVVVDERDAGIVSRSHGSDQVVIGAGVPALVVVLIAHVPRHQLVHSIRAFGQGHFVCSVELVPGNWRVEWRMRFDEARPRKERAASIPIAQKLDGAVGCPVSRVVFRGQLGRLRDVVKLAAYSMWFIHMLVRGFHQMLKEFVVLDTPGDFLAEFHKLKSEWMPSRSKVHLPNGAGLITCRSEHSRNRWQRLIHRMAVIRTSTAMWVKPCQQGISGRDTDRAGGVGTVKLYPCRA